MRRRDKAAGTLLAAIVVYRTWRASRKYGIPFMVLIEDVKRELDRAAQLEDDLKQIRYTAARAADRN